MADLIPYFQSPFSAQDALLARMTSQYLVRYTGRDSPLTLRVMEETQEQPIALPPVALNMLLEILDAIAEGRRITIIPENTELTTVQAAELLNVSRPYLIKLLDERAIPFRKLGKHRRIRIEDVMRYKLQIDNERESVLDQLVEEAQKHDMGYTHS